ncbi:MAG TPA: magnesium transporter [Dehalococcoidia bacterium]|nr:magnesium transporter [Dehalococcoidia bacterium]
MSQARALASESPPISVLAADTFRTSPGTTVEAVLDRIRRNPATPPLWIAVCDGDVLSGLTASAFLLSADPSTAIENVSRAGIVRVPATTTAESAAWLATMADAEVVVAEDESGRFLGIAPLSRFLPLLAHEHEEDMARLGGFLRGARVARTASEEAVHRRVLHRAPWLLVGLIGAVVAAQMVRAFEAELEETVAIAFFLPGIVYMADAVGTQTETLVIRGLSVGVPIRRILRLEAVTGAVVGGLLSLALFPLALLITEDTSLSLAIALSLLASATCATLLAMSLPWLMDRIGIDPAFGSGPLATVLQDLLSILIYFSLAVALIS